MQCILVSTGLRWWQPLQRFQILRPNRLHVAIAALRTLGILSWGNDGRGMALNDRRMHGLRVISPIACHCQQWLLGRNLLQQLRQHRSVSDIVRNNIDSPYLQRLRINNDLQLAPLAAALCPMLFAPPLAFAKELDACGVNQ